MCKFCENLAIRIWLFIAIIFAFVFVLGGLLLLGVTLPVVILPVWAVVLAVLRFGFKRAITPSLAFSAFSFVAWYAFNLVMNTIALIICSIGYLINLRKSKDFTPYLLRYAPATGAVFYIFSLLGRMS